MIKSWIDQFNYYQLHAQEIEAEIDRYRKKRLAEQQRAYREANRERLAEQKKKAHQE